MSWDGRLRADARNLPIASESVQCCVTSPPYWGLRDYGNPGQIGLERTPEEYVASMLDVFREVRRALKSDGTLWLNLGDSYCTTAPGTRMAGNSATSTLIRHARLDAQDAERAKNIHPKTPSGLKPKDLVGIPWRVAFALQADGWYLRSDIIWNKPNPMPESVTDRPTRAHEYLFLLTKSARYYYDYEAIKETANVKNWRDCPTGRDETAAGPADSGMQNGRYFTDRNKRSVWTISTQPYPEAHYATFPEEIPETCIKAGSRPGDLILDPFFGSGTVGRVAERLSRRWIGCDLGYYDLQKQRLQDVQKALIFDVQ